MPNTFLVVRVIDYTVVTVVINTNLLKVDSEKDVLDTLETA